MVCFVSQMLITCLAHGRLSNICEGIRLSTSVYKPFNLQSLISSPVLTFILETSDTRFTSRPAGGGGPERRSAEAPPRRPSHTRRPPPGLPPVLQCTRPTTHRFKYTAPWHRLQPSPLFPELRHLQTETYPLSNNGPRVVCRPPGAG